MINKKLFWQNKTCVVTGGTGFIGSHLCSALYDLGADVCNIDIESNGDGTAFEVINKNKNIPFIKADLSNKGSMKVVQKLEPEIIFHLAAIPYGPTTSLDPHRAYYSNVNSTANMLEITRIIGADLVFTSSACYFGAALSSPLKANDPVCPPEHFYTYTKRMAEDLINSYSDFYNVRCAICRFVNVFGPGDRHAGRIVPSICLQLIQNNHDTLELSRSYGESTFEFLFVKDAVEGLLAAAENIDQKNRLYQFGPGQMSRLNIIELAEKISELYDNKRRSIVFKLEHPEKRVRKYLDTADTSHRLSWECAWNLEKGIKETLSWYQSNYSRIIFYK